MLNAGFVRSVVVKSNFLIRQRCFLNQTKVFLSSTANEEVRVRFAPSPTGKLHIGGLRTAFYNYLFAYKYGGTFILRIEDTDQERFKEGSVEFLLESLDWAGIKPDYAPHLKRDDDSTQGAPWQQSQRLHLYKQYAHRLLDSNKAYRCFCDEPRLELLRREAQKRQEKISYDGKCSHLDSASVQQYIDEGRKHVIRFKLDDRPITFKDLTVGMHSSNPGRNEGDFIIVKSDGYPTYHFAHVVDDHLMRVSHVLRGQEWLLSTPKHIAIFDAFGWKPPQYGHLPLICNLDGTKISKRQNDIDVLSYRDRGYFPETILTYLSSIGGGFKTNIQETEEFFPSTKTVVATLAENFDEYRISGRSVRLNQELLDRLNRRFLKLKLENELETSQLVEQLRMQLIKSVPNISNQYTGSVYLEAVLKWSVERIFKVNDLAIEPDFAFLWTDMSSFNVNNMTEDQRLKMLELIEGLDEHLKREATNQALFTDKAVFKKELTLLFKELKVKSPVAKSDKKTNYWQMIRLVLTGSLNGPPVFEIFNLLEKKNLVYRLEIARNILGNKVN